MEVKDHFPCGLDAQELQAQIFHLVSKQQALSFIISVLLLIYLKARTLRIQCMSLVCHVQHEPIK